LRAQKRELRPFRREAQPDALADARAWLGAERRRATPGEPSWRRTLRHGAEPSMTSAGIDASLARSLDELMDRDKLERISLDVMAAHGCHTVILYGSWARGQATENSDLDLLCVRREGPNVRDARIVRGIYLDAFIYSEASIATPEPALLRVLGGRILCEEGGCGTGLLARLQALHDRGPEPLQEDVRKAVLLWSSKMLERFRDQRGLEPNYRRMQLFTQSLEDYFALRGIWFPGPKVAFAWLRQHDAALHEQFERSAQKDASDADFAELVRAVYGPFQSVG
jgi:predicted nucleotidyltransferase